MRHIIALLTFASAIVYPASAFAENWSEKGFNRVSQSIQYSSAPPTQIIVSAAILAVLIIISAVYYKNISGGKK